MKIAIRSCSRSIDSTAREAQTGEFRTDLYRGGSLSSIKITPEKRSTAVRAVQAPGLDVAAVDILRSNRGTILMEVDSSHGLKSIETITGKDMAGMMISHIERNTGPDPTGARG